MAQEICCPQLRISKASHAVFHLLHVVIATSHAFICTRSRQAIVMSNLSREKLDDLHTSPNQNSESRLMVVSIARAQVQRRTGSYPMMLYDTIFGCLPGWKQLAEAAGGVKGTRGNCEALMSDVRLPFALGPAFDEMTRTSNDQQAPIVT